MRIHYETTFVSHRFHGCSRNSDGLESTYYARRSADYAWQLFIAAGVILVRSSESFHHAQPYLINITQGLSRPLHTVVHTRPLLIALTYVSSLLAPPGAQSSIFGLVTLPVRYYPYLMVAMDLLMAGPAVAASGVVGLVVGHGWWWGVFGGPGGRGVLERWSKAPAWVKSIVNDRPPGAAAPSGGVHATAPRARAGPEPRSGSTTGYQWGSGRRLGDS